MSKSQKMKFSSRLAKSRSSLSFLLIVSALLLSHCASAAKDPFRGENEEETSNLLSQVQENEAFLRLYQVSPAANDYVRKSIYNVHKQKHYYWRAKAEFEEKDVLKDRWPTISQNQILYGKLLWCVHRQITRPIKLKIASPRDHTHLTMHVRLIPAAWANLRLIGPDAGGLQRILSFRGGETTVSVWVDTHGEISATVNGEPVELMASHLLNDNTWTTLHFAYKGSYPEAPFNGDHEWVPRDGQETGRVVQGLPPGYSAGPTQGGGHCQFAALAEAILGDQQRYQELRDRLADFLSHDENWHDFEGFADDGELGDASTPEGRREMAESFRNDTWGTHLTLQILGELYGYKIVVFTYHSNWTRTVTGDLFSDRVIYIKCRDQHYELIKPALWTLNVLSTRAIMHRNEDNDTRELENNYVKSFMRSYGTEKQQDVTRRNLAWGSFKHTQQNHFTPEFLWVGNNLDYIGDYVTDINSFVEVKNIEIWQAPNIEMEDEYVPHERYSDEQDTSALEKCLMEASVM